MTGKPEDRTDWSQTTWKGSRLQQHRQFHALSFSRKLELVEELNEMAGQFSKGSKPTKSPAALRESASSLPSQMVDAKKLRSQD
jgi:hypothetical protein